MKNVICWDTHQVSRIINKDAEAMPDAVFRAVHSEQPLRIARPAEARFQLLKARAYQPMGAFEFLAEFLREDRSHMQVAVLGDSGSGKSHLIHWMRLAIMTLSHLDKRIVITIPKTGMGLRRVVEMIIDELPSSGQSAFRADLARVSDSLVTEESQKHALLDKLAQAIREEQPVVVGPDGEREAALIRQLPDIFQDVYFRKEYFLKADGVVNALVRHVFAGGPGYRPLDDRHRFRASDLPIESPDLANASKPAREAIVLLQKQPERTLPIAVALINRALDRSAIASTFGFSAARVSQLMEELRHYLRSIDRELILLIEDFAQLQGVEAALLQALLDQGNETRCNIRWAIASTTGVFETIAETVYTRMDYFVDMNRSAGDKKAEGMTQATLASFAGRYLNAVRLGSNKLSEWMATSSPTDPVPNACEHCPYGEPCHATFETSDEGFGLYPFTARAVWNMGLRASEQLETRFNPRAIQRNVLIPVLDDHAASLKAGRFPPRRLLDELGGIIKLTSAERDRLLRSVGPNEYDRSITFQELYDGSSTIQQPPEGIARVFGLSTLTTVVSEPSAVENPAPLEPPTAAAVDSRIAALDNWSATKGKALEQTLVTTLRVAVYQLIYGAIDWDKEKLERAKFASPTGARPFRQMSIAFAGQDTRTKDQGVFLMIPSEEADEATFNRTALALQGLILAGQHNGEWTFANGGTMLLALLECLDEWRADVLRQMRRPLNSTPTWKPADAAVELLGIGACLAGAFKSSETSIELMGAALGPWRSEPAAQSKGLTWTYKQLFQQKASLVALIRSVSSGSKGGKAGAFLDPGAVLPVLSSLRRQSWKLAQTPPDDLSGEWKALAKLYRETAERLGAAVVEEKALRLAWLHEMRSAFGPDAKRQEIIEATERVRDATVAVGLGGRKALPVLEALEPFRTVQYDDAVRAIASIEDEQDALRALPEYGRARNNAISAGKALADALGDFLADVEANLTNLEIPLAKDAGSMPADIEEIRSSLDVLVKLLPMHST